MVVIRRDKRSSVEDLVLAIEKFCSLLIKQKEDEASAQLLDCATELNSKPSSDEVSKIAKKILQIFQDQELEVYMQSKINYSSWTDSDDLLEACSRVYTLVKRLV